MFPTKAARLRPALRTPKAARPTLEGLEDRLLLYATSGARWQYGSHITYSFMPDGTSLGGTPMIMNQRMNAEGISTANWELQIQKAAAVWEAVSGIQLAQVFDNGATVGIYGDQQDDPRFGDIRIGGFSQGNYNQLAFTFYPPPYNGGTDAGDIFFNTDQSWQTNGSNWDLETVAIHEFGHALGMAHSTVNTAEMYAYYTYTGQQLSTDDIQGIQAIYGAAVADPDNNTLATAIDITPYLNAQGQLTIGNLRLSSPVNDVDWFHVTTPGSSTGQLQVTMQAAGLSSMCPFVLIYNQAGTQILNYAIAPNSYGQGIVNVSVPASAGQGFYIRCQGGAGGLRPRECRRLRPEDQLLLHPAAAGPRAGHRRRLAAGSGRRRRRADRDRRVRPRRRDQRGPPELQAGVAGGQWRRDPPARRQCDPPGQPGRRVRGHRCARGLPLRDGRRDRRLAADRPGRPQEGRPHAEGHHRQGPPVRRPGGRPLADARSPGPVGPPPRVVTASPGYRRRRPVSASSGRARRRPCGKWRGSVIFRRFRSRISPSRCASPRVSRAIERSVSPGWTM